MQYKFIFSKEGMGYVKNVTPIDFTSVKTDALVFTCEVEPLDIDMFEANVWVNFENLISQTTDLCWTILVENDAGEKLAEFQTEDDRVGWTRSTTCSASDARILYEVANTFKEYLMTAALKIAMAKAAGVATAVASAIGPDPSVAVAAHASASGPEIDRVVEAIKAKTKADIVKPKETLADYVCNDILMAELQEVKNFFEDAATYAAAGVKLPKGILFKGVPGTGKTYAARCIAGSTECWFMTCTASSLQGQYIGSGAENIRNVFEGAKLLKEQSGKGVIIFLDELDSFGSRERHGGSSSGEEDRTLNQLLAEMSGFEDAEGIMVLGATNYPDRLDDALLRSGRFSRQISINLPDDYERQKLVSYYFSKIKIPLDKDCDIDDIVALTKSLSPADICEIANEAGILTIREKGKAITLRVVNEAINKVITKNIRKPDRSPEFARTVAIHECGHVLAEIVYSQRYPVKVTNFSYGDAGGFTQPGDRSEGIIDKAQYKAEVLGLLGGRAAEHVLCPEISTGASEDIDRAKKMIRRYYERYAFESYEVKDLDQKVQDTLVSWCAECVNMFKEPDFIKVLNNLTAELCARRVLYTKDLAAIAGHLI
jgi:ATP-dependent 26S proteasome regulatory subunit